MAAPPTDLMTAQVARMFFDRQLSKVEIAKRLGISRFRVARLIDQALAQGLVRIEFRDVPTQDREVSQAIENAWGLHLCAVAVAPPDDDPLLVVAPLAAAVIGELLGPQDVIGIAWGSTLAAVVRELTPRDDPGITVVQLAGSSALLDPEESPPELTRLLARRLGGVPQPLFAPAYVESRELREGLLREPEIRQAYERFTSLTMAIVGIGAFPQPGFAGRSALLRSNVVSKTDIDAMREAGAVGDLILYTFNAAGEFVPAHVAEHAIAVPIETLRSVPRVIAVAAGADKAPAIKGALATGVIDILITDQSAATLLAEGPAAPEVLPIATAKS